MRKLLWFLNYRVMIFQSGGRVFRATSQSRIQPSVRGPVTWRYWKTCLWILQGEFVFSIRIWNYFTTQFCIVSLKLRHSIATFGILPICCIIIILWYRNIAVSALLNGWRGVDQEQVEKSSSLWLVKVIFYLCCWCMACVLNHLFSRG